MANQVACWSTSQISVPGGTCGGVMLPGRPIPRKRPPAALDPVLIVAMYVSRMCPFGVRSWILSFSRMRKSDSNSTGVIQQPRPVISQLASTVVKSTTDSTPSGERESLVQLEILPENPYVFVPSSGYVDDHYIRFLHSRRSLGHFSHGVRGFERRDNAFCSRQQSAGF